MNKISIIIPVYNASQYLAECLDSILAQSFQDIEIICINDGSTDDSLHILKYYQRKDSRIIVVDQDNKGVSSARNAGINLASGKYLYFLDGDDLLATNSLSFIVESDRFGNSEIILGGFSYLFNNGSSLHVRNKSQFYFNEMKEKLLVDYVTWNLKIIMGSFMVQSELIKKNNIRFNEGQSFAEDVEFIVKMLYLSSTAFVIEENMNIYRLHSASAIGSVNLKRFESYFSRKRLLDFFSAETEFLELIEIYRGYLIPEAIITIIELWARKGKNFVILNNFLRRHKVLDDLYLESYNRHMPGNLVNEIRKYMSSPSSYFCRKRIHELKYNIKAFAYKKLKS